MYTWARLSLVFISDASTTQARLRLKRPERRNKHVRKRMHKDQFFPFFFYLWLMLVFTLQQVKKKAQA